MLSILQRRHEPICKKTQQKKRKVFDSSKQRVEGTEVVATKRRGQPTRVMYHYIVNISVCWF